MKDHKKVVLVWAITLILSFNSNGQTFVGQIHVGDKMPSKINIGGFREESAENCACRVFSIRYQEGGGEVIAIHYNKQDTVAGVIIIKMRASSLDAQQVYNGRLSEYMRTQSVFKDRQLIKVRDTDNGVVDGIYYFIYSFDNGTIYQATGIVNNTLIEETYYPKSSYLPKLKN